MGLEETWSEMLEDTAKFPFLELWMTFAGGFNIIEMNKELAETEFELCMTCGY